MSASLHSFYASPLDTTRRPCISRTCGSMNRGSLRRSIFLLSFSILTPSCIILPMTFQSLSIFEIVLINLLAILISYISLQHLSSACHKHQIFDYYNLVYHVLDQAGRLFTCIILILHWVFVIASYMNLLSYFVPNIYQPLKLDLNEKEEKLYTLILASLFIILPLSLFKDLENMFFSKFSNAVGVGYIIVASAYGVVFRPISEKIRWFPEKLQDSPAFACIFSVYIGYYYLPTIENYLFEPTESRMRKILLRSLMPIGLIYLFISISPIIFPIGSEKSWTSISEELMILLNLIILIPTSVVTLKIIILDIFDIEAKLLLYKLFRNFFMSLIIIGTACAIALFFDKIIILFCISGVLNCILMVFVPGIWYLVLLNCQWNWGKKCLGLGYCFVVIGYAVAGLRKAVVM